MRTSDVFKVMIVLILLAFVGGFIFRVLFKLGILALIILAGMYLFKKVFGS